MKELEISGCIFIDSTQPFDASRELINGNLGHVNDVAQSTMVVSHQDIEGRYEVLPRILPRMLNTLEEYFLDELGCG